MSALNHACFLLADRSLLRDMGSGFRDRREHFEPADLWPWIIVVLAVAAGLMLLSRWLARGDAQHFFHSTRGLLRTLSQAHGLSRADQRVLSLIARARGIETVASLFLTPEAFELDEHSPLELVRHAEAIAAIADRVFATRSQSTEPNATDNEQPDTSAAPDGDEVDAVNAMIHEGSPVARDMSSASAGDAGETADWSESAARVGVATAAETRRAGATAPSAQPRTTWAAPPSLFEPVPATLTPIKPVAPSKATASRVEGLSDGSTDDRTTTFTEHQAVKALETLMRQINATRAATSPSAAPGFGVANYPAASGNSALPEAAADAANLSPVMQSFAAR